MRKLFFLLLLPSVLLAQGIFPDANEANGDKQDPQATKSGAQLPALNGEVTASTQTPLAKGSLGVVRAGKPAVMDGLWKERLSVSKSPEPTAKEPVITQNVVSTATPGVATVLPRPKKTMTKAQLESLKGGGSSLVGPTPTKASVVDSSPLGSTTPIPKPLGVVGESASVDSPSVTEVRPIVGKGSAASTMESKPVIKPSLGGKSHIPGKKAAKPAVMQWPPVGPTWSFDKEPLREIFLDPRFPAPTVLGKVAKVQTTDMPQERPTEIDPVIKARYAQINFWRDYLSFFPKLRSVVRLSDGGGYVVWSNGRVQPRGTSIRFDLASNDGVAVPRVYAQGVRPPVVEIKLVMIGEHEVFVVISKLGDKLFVGSEQFNWSLPWAWQGRMNSNALSAYEGATASAPYTPPSPAVASGPTSAATPTPTGVGQSPSVGSLLHELGVVAPSPTTPQPAIH